MKVKNKSSAAQNILVVDDDSDFRWIVCNILRNEGYKTLEADGLDAAIKAFQKKKPDLVILDYRMPGYPGIR